MSSPNGPVSDPSAASASAPLPRFEIGLVLAGAVSAGAYQAGVLDFLLEALHAWQDALQEEDARLADGTLSGPRLPRHEVCIKVIAGASAGSISGALLALRAGERYRLMTDRDAMSYASRDVEPKEPLSPLFESWVRQIDIEQLLSLDDDPDGEGAIPSLLNGRAVDRIVTNLASRRRGDAVARSVLADPLEIRFSACNLDGVERTIAMNAGDRMAGHGLRGHAHTFEFALHHDRAVARDDDSPGAVGPLDVGAGSGTSAQATARLFEAALASSAFPLGLPSRRVTHVVGASTPQATSLTSHFVDGGVFNNEPIAEAQRVLWPPGIDETSRGRRALILVDPFPEQPESWNTDKPRLADTLWRLLTAWKNDARSRAADISAAENPANFGMFLLAPSRPTNPGAEAGQRRHLHITSAALGAFGGFFHSSFRVHDYLLGRRNAQQFLAHWFSLPESNPLFAPWPAQAAKGYFRTAGQQGGVELPIIPLIGDLHPSKAGGLPLPNWPRVRLDPESLQRRIRRRVAHVIDREFVFPPAKLTLFEPVWRWLQRAALALLKRKIADLIWKRVEKEFSDAGLRTPDPHASK